MIFLIIAIIQQIVGILIAYSLREIIFEKYQLYILTGLIFDFIGVILVSNIAIKKDNKFIHLIDLIYGVFYYILIFIPLGIIFGNLLLPLFNVEVNDQLLKFSSTILYIGVALFGIDCLTSGFKFRNNLVTGVHLIGFYYIATGFIFQIIGALFQYNIII